MYFAGGCLKSSVSARRPFDADHVARPENGFMSPSASEEFASLFNGHEAKHDRLTHYLFRYPAKFHPPIARALIQKFSKPGQTIFDPFCGSGTAAVEALATGRNSVAMDIDPVAVAVATAKTRRIQPNALRASAAKVLRKLDMRERTSREYEYRQFVDLSQANFRTQARPVRAYIPHLPNIEHWFRRYAIIDLAWIDRTIIEIDLPSAHKQFFEIVFASIIRSASNADPVPVSGLEVTSHMIRRDEEGRVVNAFALFRRALTKALDASESFYRATAPGLAVRVFAGDATEIPKLREEIDCILTSPPYHGAVDYYRRHTLEMYWLGKTSNRGQRLLLLDKYVGRLSVSKRNSLVASAAALPPLALRWEKRIRAVSNARANGFRHYTTAMKLAFDGMAGLLRAGSPAVLVVGNSHWNNTEIPTDALLAELADDHFKLVDVFSYPLKNRYMSYSRHNGADIKTEHVLVFHKRARNK